MRFRSGTRLNPINASPKKVKTLTFVLVGIVFADIPLVDIPFVDIPLADMGLAATILLGIVIAEVVEFTWFPSSFFLHGYLL